MSSGSRAQLEEVIIAAIESALLELHTGLPARVVTFDPTSQSCNAQPLLQRVVSDPERGLVAINLPQVTNVPVIFPAGGGFAMTWPLIPGDVVFLAFAERSIDAWLDAAPGLGVDPAEARRHNLSDAIAIPGLRQRTAPLPGLATSSLKVGLEDGTTILEIFPDGRLVLAASLAVLLGSASAASPFVKGDALMTWLASHTHPTAAVGPASIPTIPPPASILSTKVRGE